MPARNGYAQFLIEVGAGKFSMSDEYQEHPSLLWHRIPAGSFSEGLSAGVAFVRNKIGVGLFYLLSRPISCCFCI
jgi:hypothetical protein